MVPVVVPLPLDGASLVLRATEGPAGRRLEAMAPALAERIVSEHLVAPRGIFALVDVAGCDESGFTLAGGGRLEAPGVVRRLGAATRLAVGFVTIGAALPDAIAEGFAQGRRLQSLGFDMIGTQSAQAASDALWDHLARLAADQGLSISSPMHPGDEGFPLECHAVLGRLVGPETIGIHIRDGGLLAPLKSLSLVAGVGVAMPRWSRHEACFRCPSRQRCTRGRRAA